MTESKIDTLRNWVERNPADARARFFLASELFRASRWVEAAEEFRSYLDTMPADPASARKDLGLCYERVGRDREAAVEFQRAVDEALACGHSGLAEEIRMLLEDLDR